MRDEKQADTQNTATRPMAEVNQGVELDAVDAERAEAEEENKNPTAVPRGQRWEQMNTMT